jgi:hypothetical protein
LPAPEGAATMNSVPASLVMAGTLARSLRR